MREIKRRIDKLETKANPVMTELDLALWRLHLESHPEDDSIPPPSCRRMTLEGLLQELSNEP
jgi:hypothetical protein